MSVAFQQIMRVAAQVYLQGEVLRLTRRAQWWRERQKEEAEKAKRKRPPAGGRRSK